MTALVSARARKRFEMTPGIPQVRVSHGQTLEHFHVSLESQNHRTSRGQHPTILTLPGGIDAVVGLESETKGLKMLTKN
jgi:hypothetical protein